MYLKRQVVPKNWPIYRKGTKYVVRPGNNLQRGVPLLVVLRDMLKIVNNRKEAKRAIHDQNILVNSKRATDEREGILLFDVIKIIPLKKAFILDLKENGKITITEIDEKESKGKVSKIINKKILKGKKIQLNLFDGRNIISDIKCDINDSVLINFNEKKIEKCISLKEGAEVIIFAGKHAGKRGIVKEIDLEKKISQIKIGEELINVLIKQFMAIK